MLVIYMTTYFISTPDENNYFFESGFILKKNPVTRCFYQFLFASTFSFPQISSSRITDERLLPNSVSE